MIEISVQNSLKFVPCRSEDLLGLETGENAHADNDTLLCGYIGTFSVLIHGDQVNIIFRTNSRYSSSRGFSAWYHGLQDTLTGIPKIVYNKQDKALPHEKFCMIRLNSFYLS